MHADYFLDTNILLYRYSDQDDDKRRISANLLESGKGMASVQVLNEFCNVISKKFPAAYAKIDNTLAEIQERLSIMPLNVIDTLTAVRICSRYQYSYYDSLILASAERHQCRVVLSEDMQSGQILESGIRIWDPFSI